MDKAAACDVIVIVSTTVGFELGGSYPLKVINCLFLFMLLQERYTTYVLSYNQTINVTFFVSSHVSSSSPVLLHLVACAAGQPPHFTQEPQDTVVYNTSLVLDCAAQGHPSPTITWYRGDPPALVSDGHVLNGSLLIPTVVEGVDASRGGIPYHCRATSDQFGTIRSRTATVYYACEVTTQ